MAWFFWVWIREKCHEIEIEQNQPSLNSITFFLIAAVQKGTVRLTVIHLHSFSVNRRQKWKAKRRTKYFLSFNLREFWRTHKNKIRWGKDTHWQIAFELKLCASYRPQCDLKNLKRMWVLRLSAYRVIGIILEFSLIAWYRAINRITIFRYEVLHIDRSICE